MHPYAGLNGLVPNGNPAAARLLQQPNGLSIQGSLPMDDMKAVWMQGQAGLVPKAGNPNQGLGGMNLGAAGPRMQQQLAGGGLQQMANGGMQQGGGGLRLDNAAALAGMGLGGQNLQAMQLQQLQQAQAQAAQQQQALQLQQQLRQQQLQQQLQAQAAQQQQQQAQIAQQLRQQQLQQQLQQQQQLLQQQQQMANAGLQGNLQSLMGANAGANQQFLLNQAGGAAAQLANSRHAELLASGLVSNQMNLQGGGAGQSLTPNQQQQLLQQHLFKQAAAAQQGAAASQGLQFGGAGGLPPSALLQQQLQQANNAVQLRNLAQLNAAQQEVQRRQHQAQLQAQQQQVQALQLQQQLQRQQHLQQLQAQAQQQQQHQQQQQQNANQQAFNAAAMAALRANAVNGNAAEREQLLRLLGAAAGKADTVGTLPSQLSTATATAALAQRQLVAGMNAQQKAALQGLVGAAAGAGGSSTPTPGANAPGSNNSAATQAMLSQLMANRSFEPANPARVGVIGQERSKQMSTDLGHGLQSSTPGLMQQSASNPALSSLTGAAASLGLTSLAPGPARQKTPPPSGTGGLLGGVAVSTAPAAAGGHGNSAAAATGPLATLGAPGIHDEAAALNSSLPLSAAPETVEAFLKTVGKRFADMGLTIEQALEFNILKGLTKEQLAVLLESQASMNSASVAKCAVGEAATGAAPVTGAAEQAVGISAADGAAAAGRNGPAATAAGAAKTREDGEDDDKILESLLDADNKPEAGAAVGIADQTAAALLTIAQADANFNAFTYGFFDDTPAGAAALGDLLGELEPEGTNGDDTAVIGTHEVSDLSALAEFEPIDPSQLASWGSIDAMGSENAVLAAAAAALSSAAAASANETGNDAAVVTVPAAPEGNTASAATAAPSNGDDDGGDDDKPAGWEQEAIAQNPVAEVLAAGLNGLSLGAGFE